MKTKTKNILAATLLMTVLIIPFVVSAQVNLGNVGTDSKLTNTSISTLITKAMQWLLYIFGFVAVIAFIIAGFMYLTAAGDESKIKTAKNAMIWSIVGIVVALAGLIIITAVMAYLGGNNVTF